MAKKRTLDGSGCVLKSGSTVIGEIEKMTLPGWKKEVINFTSLENEVAVKTLSKLKEYNDFGVTILFSGANQITEGNKEYTIELPDSIGSLKFFGDLSEMSDIAVEAKGKLSCDLKITVTNIDPATGAESAPVLTISAGA